ncbi:unnamed protein product, partial [marine sediment metagenome]
MVQPSMSGTPIDVATTLLNRTVNDLYDFLKDKITFTIDKSRLQRQIPELVNRINSFRMVKTLWQMDFPVDVEQFYCSSYVLIPRSTDSSLIGRKSPRKRKKID